MRNNNIAKTGLFFMLMSMLTACSMSDDRPAQPRAVEIELQASKNCNPDRDGRAAPVQVLLYSLSNADNFSNSDYLTLARGANPALLSDSKNQQQLILKPGESRTLKLEADKDIHFYGLVAAYRNIDAAQWNAVYALNEEKSDHWYQALLPESKKPLKLLVKIDKLSISVKEAN